MHPECQTTQVAPWILNFRNQGASWKLNIVSQARAHPTINYIKTAISVLLLFMHGNGIPNEAPLEMPMDLYWISKVTIPLIFYDTCHTFWLSVASFWQHVFTRSVPHKIKAPVQFNPFVVVVFFFCFVFCFFWLVRTIVHWPVNIWPIKSLL